MAHTPYYVSGRRVPSVTTVISNCKLGGIEPLLIWANKCGINGLSHRDEANFAADVGTVAHEKISAFIKGIEFDAEPYSYEMLDASEPCYKAFLEWHNQSKFNLVESEVSLVSEKYNYGGTLDAIIEMDGRLMLCDWKTSNHVYADYLIQLSAYQNLWRENFPDRPITNEAYLLRVSKGDTVTFTTHYWNDLSLAWDTFMKMRELYDMHKELKKLC